MADDTAEDIGRAEDTGGMDLDEILLLFGLVIGIAVILAIVFDYKQVALLGVGLISSFTNLPSSGFNGLSGTITAFFNGLDKSISNGLFWILPARGQILLVQIQAVFASPAVG